MDVTRIGRSNEMVIDMKALKISRKTAKFAVARLMSPVSTIGAAKFGPLSLVNESAPTMPNAAQIAVAIAPKIGGAALTAVSTRIDLASRLPIAFATPREIALETALKEVQEELKALKM